MCFVTGVHSSYATPHFTSQTKSLLSWQVFDHVCGKNILCCRCSVLVRKDIKIVTSGYCNGIGMTWLRLHIRFLLPSSSDFSVLQVSGLALEAHPASNRVGPRTKWPRREVGRSRPHDTCTSPVCLHGLETDDFFNLFSAVEILILLLWSMTGHQMMWDNKVWGSYKSCINSIIRSSLLQNRHYKFDESIDIAKTT
jgi:hypothetical protein